MSVKRLLSSLLTLGATVAFTLGAIAPVEAQQRQTLRFATSNVGSYGYAVGNVISDLLQKNLKGNYAVVVQPYPSTSGAMRSVMDGDGEFAYTADVGMRGLYDGDRPYDKFKAKKGRLVHTLYVYPMETFMLVPERRAKDFSSYKDFDGKPVYFTPAGFMNWLNMRRVFAALGYEFNHVEIDNSTVADGFEAGTIVGSAGYTTAGVSLPTYWRETELRTKLAAINPTEAERKVLAEKGLNPVKVDPTQAFSQDLNVDAIWAVPIYFAYNVRADMDAKLVKQVLDILYKNADKLVEGDKGFAPLAADFVGTQASGVAANPDVPVHPGLAEFLKEHGAWNENWTIAGN